MQQDKPKQLRGRVALEFDVSEMPTKSAAQSGFGRGYTIGFLACVALTAASFAAMFLAGSERGRVRAIGYLLFSFGAFFTFAIGYTIVTGKGIPWAASAFGRVQTGEWNRKTTAIRFWACCAIVLLICSLLIGGGIWVVVHAKDVAAFLQHKHQWSLANRPAA